jgi:hypothetical protein
LLWYIVGTGVDVHGLFTYVGTPVDGWYGMGFVIEHVDDQLKVDDTVTMPSWIQ